MGQTKKRIAFFTPSLNAGGAEKMLTTLAREFLRLEYEVHIIVATAAVGEFASDLPNGISITELGSKGVLASTRPLIRFLRKCNPDIVISSNGHANIVAVIANFFSGIRSQVLITETTTPSRNRKNHPFLTRWTLDVLFRIIYPFASKVIALSQGIADDLTNHYGISTSKIAMIYCPAISRDFESKVNEPIQEGVLSSPSVPFIVSVGRFNQAKRFDTLIEAFALVRESFDYKLLILGEGELRSELEALVDRLGIREDVLMPGFVRNPMSFVKHAALYVCSSELEGMPLAPVEALGCGCPVVSTDCQSGPREILLDGKLGELVPVSNPIALAAAIKASLAAQPNRDELRARAKDFSIEAIAPKYEQLFKIHSKHQ